MGKRLVLVFAAGLLILGQFADCMPSMASNQQSMKCCASMPCNPANMPQNCCKTMSASRPSSMLPTVQTTLQAPTISIVEHVRMFEDAVHISALPLEAETPQHSPPELYTLYSSLLI